MTDYSALKSRLDGSEVVLLDGAIGTQLQAMAVPMSNLAWAATALETHPFTVRRMHERYLGAGVDILTTNTYSAARHNLEPLGLGERLCELNLRAVMLAEDARARAAGDRAVWIAGSVSNYGLVVGREGDWPPSAHFPRRSETSEAQARANLRDQAAILADAGVDFLLAEATGGHRHRMWVVEACLATGLPVWVGFKVHLDPGDPEPRVGYQSADRLADTLDEVMALGGEAVTLFHSSVAACEAALPIVKAHWKGPIGVYPEAERGDYVARYRDQAAPTPLSPDDFVAHARDWVAEGVQIVGGCCGVELEHIRRLRAALPPRLPEAA